MKALFASLVCFVLTAVQGFAIGGGPDYGGGGITTTGIYAGVLMPGYLSPGQNSIGLYSISIPRQGLGAGNVVIFGEGLTYTGTFTGVADPDSAKLVGEIDASFTPISVSDSTNVIVISFKTATASGRLNAQLTSNSNQFSTAAVRMSGQADIAFAVTNDGVNFSVRNEIVYDVIGFKQAEATS